MRKLYKDMRKIVSDEGGHAVADAINNCPSASSLHTRKPKNDQLSHNARTTLKIRNNSDSHKTHSSVIWQRESETIG